MLTMHCYKGLTTDPCSEQWEYDFTHTNNESDRETDRQADEPTDRLETEDWQATWWRIFEQCVGMQGVKTRMDGIRTAFYIHHKYFHVLYWLPLCASRQWWGIWLNSKDEKLLLTNTVNLFDIQNIYLHLYWFVHFTTKGPLEYRCGLGMVVKWLHDVKKMINTLGWSSWKAIKQFVSNYWYIIYNHYTFLTTNNPTVCPASHLTSSLLAALYRSAAHTFGNNTDDEFTGQPRRHYSNLCVSSFWSVLPLTIQR